MYRGTSNLVGAVLSLLLAGCVSVGNSDLVNEQVMGQIKVGQTTKQQVASLLGEPESQRVSEMSGASKEWWAYSYSSATINPIDYLLLYGLLYNGIGMYDTRYDVKVFFDYRGVVSALTSAKTDYDMGRPFVPGQVATVSKKVLGLSEPVTQPVTFEDRMESRY